MRIACVLVLLALLPGDTAPALTVSAAISLTNALEALASVYQRAGGPPVRFNFGSSNGLARQIVRGAPADVFISADDAQMNLAEASGAIAKGTRVRLLGNRLALIARHGVSVADARALAAPGVRRIAVGDPDAVPAGVYARQYLERIGVWASLQPKLVPVANVRAARAAVETGGADAGFVYQSDTVSLRRARTAFVVGGPDAPPIVYPAAIVKSSRRRGDADRFLKFLCGAEAAAVFAEHRFIPLGCR